MKNLGLFTVAASLLLQTMGMPVMAQAPAPNDLIAKLLHAAIEQFNGGMEVEIEVEKEYSPAAQEHIENQAHMPTKSYPGTWPGTKISLKTEKNAWKLVRSYEMAFPGQSKVPKQESWCFVDGVTTKWDIGEKIFQRMPGKIAPGLELQHLLGFALPGNPDIWIHDLVLKQKTPILDGRFISKESDDLTIDVILDPSIDFLPSRIRLTSPDGKIVRECQWSWLPSTDGCPHKPKEFVVTSFIDHKKSDTWYRDKYKFIKCNEYNHVISVPKIDDLPKGTRVVDDVLNLQFTVGASEPKSSDK